MVHNDLTEVAVSTTRRALTATGLAFAVMEAIDSFFIDVPAFAVLFAALFLAATAWFWRRDSGRAAVALLLLFAFEVAQAPSWKDTPIGAKVGAVTLGAAGIAAGLSVLLTRRHRRVLAS